MNFMLLLQAAQIALWVLVIYETRKRRRLLQDAGLVLWNMPLVNDLDWQRRAIEVSKRIDQEVGIP